MVGTVVVVRPRMGGVVWAVGKNGMGGKGGGGGAPKMAWRLAVRVLAILAW